ncbi:MAG: substrate-binding domain-containing protein [Ruminiclostridium sp.]|nr:substrate-binding domain-containing protein [Ruminiclostridium sp.]
MEPHEKLPSRNYIGKTLKVARITVDRAISELIGEGLLYALDGSGTYVLDKRGFETGNIGNAAWGVILPHLDIFIFPELIKAIEEVASKNNVHTIICNTKDDNEREEYYIKKLIASKVQGIIIVPSTHEDSMRINAYKLLKQNNIPFLFCVRDVKGFEAPLVKSNDFFGCYIATRHLIEHKAAPIAFISQKRYSTIDQRFQGYMAALSEYGIELNYDYIYMHNNYDEKEAAIKGVEYILKSSTLPKAIVCFNDLVAFEVYEMLKSNGINVPDDVAIIGYDDSIICDIMPVKLSSIRYPKYQVGLKAAELLAGIINKDEKSLKVLKAGSNLIIIPPELSVRESCGCKAKMINSIA